MRKPTAIFLGLPVQLELAYPSGLRERIAERAEILPGGEATAASLEQAELIFSTWGIPKLDEAFLESAPRLGAVFYAAGSVKGFVTEAAMARGVLICSGWAANAVPVCEYAESVIRLGLKQFFAYMRRTREHREYSHSIPVAGGYGASVGLVSLGAIGRLVLRELAKGDLRVLVYDPLLSEPEIRALGGQKASLEQVFSTCDVVSLHTPWLPETEKMVNEALLRSLKPGATFINTARGAVVDEAALCRVFAERADLTAVLDVTYPEPPSPDSALFSLPNVILTPHIAGSMGREVERMGLWMVEEFERWLRNEPLLHAVQAERLAVSA